jgi:hypothetical protein
MLDTLVEAVDFIKESDDKEICLQLLLNCQEVLKAIKKVLYENEKYISNKTILNELNFCDEQVSFLIKSIQVKSCIREQAISLSDRVRILQSIYSNGINITYRVVFFAELGQKWDSMNSVYQAFKKRNDCNVKVVLTPIFRAVQSNGELKTDIIYDDYLTPMGISYIPYQEYNIAKEIPDIAFISNPYESVTLNQFWPENISKHTRLVYLPYYTGMIVNENSIQTHCGLPVAKYAWRIISQSQKIKEIHERYAPNKGKNVLVTGLPKWDDIFINSVESFENESNWKEKLQGKTIFLWNSHYDVNSETSTLLEYGQAIINIFTNRKDIALIWRPHPMTGTIFKLYLPHLASFWEELIDIINSSDNMIFDTNTSYKWAFQYSNALISDWSSILTQYLLTQKPILWLRKAGALEGISKLEKLIHVESLEQAYNQEEIDGYVARVTSKIDLTLSSRLRILQEDMLGADGNIGEKVCNLLIKEFKQEVN